MTDTQACRSCGQGKPPTAYRKTRHGKQCVTCRACQNAVGRANVEQKMLTDPEYAARHRQKAREAAARAYAAKAPARAAAAEARYGSMDTAERERATAMDTTVRERGAASIAARERAAAKAAEAVAAAAALASETTAIERRIRDSGLLDNKGRLQQEEALQDAIWETLRTQRALREERLAAPRPDAHHRVKLRGNGGHVGIAEFALRCAEREACYRASSSRKLLPAACELIALLE